MAVAELLSFSRALPNKRSYLILQARHHAPWILLYHSTHGTTPLRL